MKTILPFVALAFGFAANLSAQTVVLRGRVEADAPNQFHLGATKIPVTSAVLNLNHWVGIDAIMKVADVGSHNAPLLLIQSIATSKRHLDMSPFPIGATGKVLVQASAGAKAAVFLDFASNSGFTPMPSLGTWLLGTSPYLLAVGKTDANGQFAADYAVPSDRQLVGLLITSQALLEDGGVWFLSNPERQAVVR
jgi:hypothetical protein